MLIIYLYMNPHDVH
jgi:hypothetical protein